MKGVAAQIITTVMSRLFTNDDLSSCVYRRANFQALGGPDFTPRRSVSYLEQTLRGTSIL